MEDNWAVKSVLYWGVDFSQNALSVELDVTKVRELVSHFQMFLLWQGKKKRFFYSFFSVIYKRLKIKILNIYDKKMLNLLCYGYFDPLRSNIKEVSL